MLLGMNYALVVPFDHKTAAWPSLSQLTQLAYVMIRKARGFIVFKSFISLIHQGFNLLRHKGFIVGMLFYYSFWKKLVDNHFSRMKKSINFLIESLVGENCTPVIAKSLGTRLQS